MRTLLSCGLALAVVRAAQAAAPAEFKVVGDWEAQVTVTEPQPLTETVRVEPPVLVAVESERHFGVPRFNPNAGGWAKGAALAGIKAQECTTPHLLEPDSLVLRAGPSPADTLLRPGVDYDLDPDWGTFGGTTNGVLRQDEAVFASYRHGLLRIDAVVLTRDGRIVLRRGEPRAAAPVPPAIEEGERRLGNIWLPGRLTRLTPALLFPVLESACPEPPPARPSAAERLLPKTMAKLRSGQHLRLLAWGDSVTVGTFVPDWQHNRWQDQFVARLRQRFPQADIELVTEAWGGRNTSSYLSEPPGSEHSYREKVLGAKPDLVVSEFVNDAGLNPAEVAERYGKLLADFQGLGAEWIILTPHYVRPDWMGLNRERDIDDDPRPYVAGLRQFAATHPVALADAARRYGRLWRQGIPYSSLMLNSINHPDARGMKLFADALMELFP